MSGYLYKNPAKAIALFIAGIIGSLLFWYTCYRAAHLSFTMDESTSFNQYIFNNASFMDIISMKTVTANNHILNTIFMAFCYHLFGVSELSLRAPNLAAHLMYMGFTGLWLWRFKNVFIFTGGFILLNCNPYLLDFFSLARGYGLSFGFLAMSIYYFSNYLDASERGFIFISLFAGIFAILSNLSLLYFVLGLYAAFNIQFFYQLSGIEGHFRSKFKAWINLNIPLFISLLFAFALFYEPIRKLLENHELYFGGDYFWRDTVNTIIIYAMNCTLTDHVLSIIKLILSALLVVGAVILVVNLFRKSKNKSVHFFGLVLVLFLVPCFAMVIAHVLFGSKIPVSRAALFLVPLYFMYLVSLFDFLLKQKTGFYLASFCFSFIVGIFIYYFFLTANLSYFEEWKINASDREAFNTIKSDYKSRFHQRKTMSVGAFWMAEPDFNFYREVYPFNELQELSRDGVGGKHDYYYLIKDNMNDLPHIKLHLMAYYPVSGYYLFRKE